MSKDFWTDRQIGRKTDRQTDVHRDGQTDRQTDVHRDRQTDRQTDRQKCENCLFNFSLSHLDSRPLALEKELRGYI